MKVFRVNVSGNSYEVEVEEITGGSTPAQQAPVSITPVVPKPVQAPKAKSASPTPAKAGSSRVKAPMPGTMLSISVEEGESVKGGQVLCMLEAMKMENEITAVGDATIQSIEVKVGDQIGAGDIIFVLG